jgi:hypothetical protein
VGERLFPQYSWAELVAPLLIPERFHEPIRSP